MRKGTKKLKIFEEFEPETPVSIDTQRLEELIDRASPLLDEIGKILQQEDDRVISVELYNDIVSALDTLEQIKRMY